MKSEVWLELEHFKLKSSMPGRKMAEVEALPIRLEFTISSAC